MWAFQYKHGDRPLEGFTIQRAAGRGGFGEVYYAVSDSGREVALKVVQGYQQIEVRGISQCMNLKSPHLVTIFDVKYNAENKPFVIMEFVAGPSLRQIIDESPAGIGTQKAAFFLREIAKGLTYLHDCGIVHRDLKPGNIFFENGYVKIGDYGLSKAISTSQHSGQTVTVGTVHYMAPEIGAGKYDKSIDIYAMGAVLYEMLTGMPPFLGASPTEVLMKHLSAEPDMSSIPQPFASVIKKAMAKDPADRYQNVQQMVEDIFGAEHVRQSVSVFSADDLSMVAERVAKKAVAGAGSSSTQIGGGVKVAAKPDVWQRLGSAFDHVGAAAARGRLRELAVPDPVVIDPLSTRHRWTLGLFVTVLAALAGTVASPRAMGAPFISILFVFLGTWCSAIGVVIAARTLLPRMRTDSAFMQKLVVGMFAGFFAAPVLMALATGAGTGGTSSLGGTLLAITVPMFLMDTRQWHAFDRAERVQFGKIFGAGFVAFLICLFSNGNKNIAIATLAGTCMLVQILSPWDPIAGARTKQKDESEEDNEDESEESESKTPAAAGATAKTIDIKSGKKSVVVTVGKGCKEDDWFNWCSEESTEQKPPVRYLHRPVWRFARLAWLGATVALLTMGVMFCVAGGLETRPLDIGPLVAAGVCSLIASVYCFCKSFQRRFYGRWGYFFKPTIMMLCGLSILASIIVMGNYPGPMNVDEAMVGAFFITFPAILFFVLLFVPGRVRLDEASAGSATAEPSAVAGVANVVAAAVASAGAETGKAVKQATESALRAARGAARDSARRRRYRRDWEMWQASRTTRRGEGFAIFLSFIASLFILAAVFMSVGLAFDIPGMLAAGIPDPQIGQELGQRVFVGVSDWPKLMTRMATVSSMIILLIGLVLLLLARRRDGVLHMVRGVVGAVGLMTASGPLNDAFQANGTWQTAAKYLAEKQTGMASDVFVQILQSKPAIMSAAMFLLFLIILAWPAPKQREPSTPKPVLKPSAPPAPPAPAPVSVAVSVDAKSEGA